MGAAHRRAARVGRRSRLYRLGRLLPPDPGPPGRARVATAADSGLLLDWLEAFGREADDHGGHDLQRTVADRLSYGGLTLWEAGGGPGVHGRGDPRRGRPGPVGPVYTPPERRGRGSAAP